MVIIQEKNRCLTQEHLISSLDSISHLNSDFSSQCAHLPLQVPKVPVYGH